MLILPLYFRIRTHCVIAAITQRRRLVHCPARVVGGGSSTGDRRVQGDDSVLLGVAGVSQKSSTGAGNETNAVDVRSVGSTQPQLVLHRRLVRAMQVDVNIHPGGSERVRRTSLLTCLDGRPCGVEGPVGVGEGEVYATRSVVGVHDADGGCDLGVRDVSTGNGCGLVDHMP